MIKVKGLLTEIKDNEQASIMILPFNTRIQDYQKVIKKVSQVYEKVFIDPYAALTPELSALNQRFSQQSKITKNKFESFQLLLQSFSETEKNWKSSNQEIKTYLDEGLTAIFEECTKISRIKDTLYDKLGLHQMKESQLVQMTKKYTKTHKILIQSIQSYKIAFQDVKLIYNIQEKVKRYKSCSNSYSSAVSLSEQINKNIEFLTNERQEIKSVLQNFNKKQSQFVGVVGRQLIKIPINLTKSMMRSRKDLLSKISDKLGKLKEKKQKNLFQKFRLPFPNPQYFDCQLKDEEVQLYPSFLANLKHLKIQHFGKCKKFLIEYYMSIRDDIKQRFAINQSIKNYFQQLIELFDKIFIQQQKELRDFINEKYLRIIQNSFYPQFATDGKNSPKKNPSKDVNFSQSILQVISFLEKLKQQSKNIYKIYSQQIKQLIAELDAQKESLNFFKEQFKSRFYSLFVGKKQFKKDLQNMKSGQIEQLELTEEEVREMREQIIKKIDFILMLVKGFSDKSKIGSSKIKNIFQQFLSEYNKQISVQIQLCNQQNKRFDDLIQAYISSQEKLIINGNQDNKWISENTIYKSIVKQNLKLKFQSQNQKVNQFKKLKKPTPDFDQNQVSTINSTNRSASNSVVLQATSPTKSSSSFQLPFSKNYEKFVKENTHFQEGQQYVANFACGLCDNIIVSGRLYITTNRLFFHSRFNSSNIFFGDTKLQIPRTDIIKIEKKYNAIIFDNSISVTTCNGEIFFTSLISRDQAYDIICKTFQIDLNKAVFEPETFLEETQQTQQNFSLNISQEDDFPDDQVQARAKILDEMILNDQKSDQKTFSIPYQNVSNQTLKFPGLTAAKVLKIYESGQEFPYKNKTFQSFWHYFKGHICKNFDMDFEQWDPSLLEYLNPSNIKKNIPLKFSRKIESSVPAPETSIPFMPKFIRCSENHELYVYSKHKFVEIIKVVNSKAPYTDCFHMRIRKIVEKLSEDSVKMSLQLKVVFIKKTMMQNMIETRTLKQSRQNYLMMHTQMQNYLKYLELKCIKSKLVGSDNQNQSNINLSESAVGSSQEQIKSKSQQLEAKSGNVSSQWDKKFYQRSLLFSVLLNFFLLFIIFNSFGDL